MCHIHADEGMFMCSLAKESVTSHASSYMCANSVLHNNWTQVMLSLKLVALAAVARSLLIRAGDVELNPGPGKCNCIILTLFLLYVCMHT